MGEAAGAAGAEEVSVAVGAAAAGVASEVSAAVGAAAGAAAGAVASGAVGVSVRSTCCCAYRFLDEREFY